jgi:hypothetical protein
MDGFSACVNLNSRPECVWSMTGQFASVTCQLEVSQLMTGKVSSWYESCASCRGKFFDQSRISLVTRPFLRLMCEFNWRRCILDIQNWGKFHSSSRTQRFNAANIKTRYWTRSWDSCIHYLPLKQFSPRSILMLSSNFLLGIIPSDTLTKFYMQLLFPPPPSELRPQNSWTTSPKDHH